MYLVLSFNLSLQEILRPEAMRHIADVVEASDLPAQRFMVEITEEAVTAIEERTTNDLSLMQNVGVQLGLDDFGSGQASVTALLDLPTQTVKLDRKLIQQIGEKTKGRSVLQSVIEMVHEIGKYVIAEGIETSEQLRVLRELGADHGQGYLLSPPVPGPKTLEIADPPWPWEDYWNAGEPTA